MRSVQVFEPNGPLEMVERDMPEPGAAQVRIKVQACGICHSDAVTTLGLLPGIKYPRTPGQGGQSRGRYRQSRQQRYRMENRTASRRGLARWP